MGATKEEQMAPNAYRVPLARHILDLQLVTASMSDFNPDEYQKPTNEMRNDAIGEWPRFLAGNVSSILPKSLSLSQRRSMHPAGSVTRLPLAPRPEKGYKLLRPPRHFGLREQAF